jgi:hypothetical protein
MIRLRPDCLAFESPQGEFIPCSAQEVVVELIGDAAQWLDKEIIAHASEAVLHYFRHEQGKEAVSTAEFLDALERVLKGLGLDIQASTVPLPASASSSSGPAPVSAGPTTAPLSPQRVVENDLCELAGRSEGGAELFFFPLLRREIHRCLEDSPLILKFRGLRDCVKRIVGTKRWTPTCQAMNDQIVEYLRTCLDIEKAGDGCALVVV